MIFETWPEGCIPLNIAYERAVGTLEPEARPGDEHLTTLAVNVSKEDDPKGDGAKTERAAYANIDDAELRIESLLRDALAKAELPSFVEVAGRLELIRNTEVWRDKPVRINRAVSVDNIFAPNEPQMAFVEEGLFDRWLSKVRGGRRQSPSDDDARESGFENVRVEREQVLKVFPPDTVAAQTASGVAPEDAERSSPRQTDMVSTRKPTKVTAAAEALQRLFPPGRPSHSRDELLREFKSRAPEIGTLSPRTLSRAIALVWPSAAPKRAN